MKEPIYIDNTMLSTFRSCKEKARLSFKEHWQPTTPAVSLSFGIAFHAALDAFYVADPALARAEKILLAQEAFIKHARLNQLIPVGIDNPEGEKRSLERGASLINAYFHKWQDEPYEVLRNPETGKPLVECAFEIHLFDFKGHPVFYVGRVDKFIKNRVDGQVYIFETKTTSTGLSEFMRHTRPNHQVSGYHMAAKVLLGYDVVGTIWDCIFLSDRQPKLNDKDEWLRQGINIEKDFGRTETRRSQTDIDEFYNDLTTDVGDYLLWSESGGVRWPRNTGACHYYGGCAFREVCTFNGNEALLKNKFEKRVWDPREKGGAVDAR